MRILLEHPRLKVIEEVVTRPDGTKSPYISIKQRSDGIVLVPVFLDVIYFVEVFRYPVKQYFLELPRGSLNIDESFSDAAERELKEELGVSGAVTQLGNIYPDAGLLHTKTAIYYAALNNRPFATTDADEISTIVGIPQHQLFRTIAEGKIQDGFSLAAICLARAASKLDNSEEVFEIHQSKKENPYTER